MTHREDPLYDYEDDDYDSDYGLEDDLDINAVFDDDLDEEY